jgi:hypothetical protein
MRNRRLKLTGLAKPVETRGLTGMFPGSARQESADWVFGRVRNRTDPLFRSKPGPLVGYPDLLRTLLVNILETVPSSNLIPFETASGSNQSSIDPSDLSSDDEEYLMPNNVAETIPGRSDPAASLFTTTSSFLNLLPEVPRSRAQIHPNFNDNHSDLMEITTSFWIQDITDC